MVEFNCTNCGACCIYPSSQVNVTLGDIHRISEYTKISADKIVNEFLDIVPFFDPKDPTNFDLEPGLKKPCKFWKEAKCSIYEARPLNCRIFPIWMFAKLNEKQLRESTIKGYECVENTKIVNEDIPIYNKYTDELGKILEFESKITEEFLKNKGFANKLNIEKYEGLIHGNLNEDKKMEVLFTILKTSGKLSNFEKLGGSIRDQLKSQTEIYEIDDKLKKIELILKP